MKPFQIAHQVCMICCDESLSSSIWNHNRGRILECFSGFSLEKGKDVEDVGFCESCTIQLISLFTLKNQVEALENELKKKASASKVKFEQMGIGEKAVYNQIRAEILGGIGNRKSAKGTLRTPVIPPQVRKLIRKIRQPLKKKFNELASYSHALLEDNIRKQTPVLENSEMQSSSSFLPGIYEKDDSNVESAEQQPPIPQRNGQKQPRMFKVCTDKITILQVDLKRVGDGTSFSCSMCHSILQNDRRVMQRHVARFHSQLYVCSSPFCGKRFSTKHCLQRHVKSAHMPKNVQETSSPHLCPVCKRPFSDLRNMRRHKWTHFSEEDQKEAIENGEKIPEGFKGQKKFQCDICAHFFSSRPLLELHQKRKHVPIEQREKEKGLCPLCGTAVLDVRDHVRRTHGEKAVNKKYECASCAKRFSSSGALIRHKKTLHDHKNSDIFK